MEANVLPACWSDDERMAVLFAPFRPKSLNSVAWESKMNFWSNLIGDYCKATRCPSMNVNDLRRAFKRNEKMPSCLNTVIENMIQCGTVDRKENLFNDETGGWIKWGVKKLIISPAAHLTNSLLSSVLPAKPIDWSSIDVVHVKSLDDLCKSFLSSVPNDKKIGSIEELKASSKIGDTISHDTMILIMNRLHSKKLATRSSDGCVFKLAKHEHDRVDCVTQNEISLLQLTKMREKLESSVVDLEKNIVSMRNAAKVSLSTGNRTMAMHHLKKKKGLEGRLIKLSNSLESLVQLHDTIMQTHTDADIMDAYKSGLRVLKSNMKQSELEEDTVLDTMDDLKQVMQEFKNIEAAISQPLDDTLDADDLEAELQALILPSDDPNDDGNNLVSLINSLDDLNISSLDSKADNKRSIKNNVQNKLLTE